MSERVRRGRKKIFHDDDPDQSTAVYGLKAVPLYPLKFLNTNALIAEGFLPDPLKSTTKRREQFRKNEKKYL